MVPAGIYTFIYVGLARKPWENVPTKSQTRALARKGLKIVPMESGLRKKTIKLIHI